MSTSSTAPTPDVAAATNSRAWRGVAIAAWIFLLTGAAFALTAIFRLEAVIDFLADLVFWPREERAGAPSRTALLLAGIAGGLLAGWATTLLILARGVLARGAAQGLDGAALRRAMAAGLIVWFALDGVASLALGAALNALGNVFFLLALGWPLWRLRL